MCEVRFVVSQQRVSKKHSDDNDESEWTQAGKK